jgi:hypothetical protein
MGCLSWPFSTSHPYNHIIGNAADTDAAPNIHCANDADAAPNIHCAADTDAATHHCTNQRAYLRPHF